MEQCLSNGADMYYEYRVSSDYYCTDEDDHVQLHNVIIVIDYGNCSVHICICFNNNIIFLLDNDDFYYTFSYYIV